MILHMELEHLSSHVTACVVTTHGELCGFGKTDLQAVRDLRAALRKSYGGSQIRLLAKGDMERAESTLVGGAWQPIEGFQVA